MADVEIYLRADNTEEAKAEMQRRIRVALEAMGIEATTLATVELQKTPSRIDTGLLRNSITHALDGESTAISDYSADRESKYTGKKPESGSYGGSMPKEGEGRAAVYVGTNVKYGIYVHEGTDRMAPNRFLKNAIENHIGKLAEIEKKYLTN